MNKLKHTPPGIADKILAWYCNPDLLEDLQGDLHERFVNRLKDQSLIKAKVLYCWDVIYFLQPYVIKNTNQIPSFTPFLMIANYFKTSIRNFKKQKVNTSVNILGLSLGLTTFILTFLFVNDELKYDRYLSNADRIYRITMSYDSETSSDHSAWSEPIIGQELKRRYPEIEAYTALVNDNVTVKQGKQTYQESQFFIATTTFFEVFPYRFINNEAPETFKSGDIILTAKTAKKYFGETRAINQPIEVDNIVYKVVGVLHDLPAQTDLKFEAIAMINDLEELGGWSFNYVLFKKKNQASTFQPKLDKVFAELIQPEFNEYNTTGQYHIEALPDVHFSASKLFDTPKSSKANLYIFSTIALLTLVIATINYINTSLASASQRRVEVGIRKSMGATSAQLKSQFLLESFIICFLSLVIAFGLSIFYLPQLNFITEKQIEIEVIFSSNVWIFITTLTTLLAIISGSYPAFYLSTLKPTDILKNSLIIKGNSRLRKGLVIFQFVVSMILIVSSIIISRQLNIIQTGSHGYDRDQVLLIDIPYDKTILATVSAFQHNIAQFPEINATSLVGQKSWPTSDRHVDAFEVSINNRRQTIPFNNIQIGEGYLNVLDLKLIQGREFNNEDMGGKFKVVMVNETFVEKANWTSPLKEYISYESGHRAKVIGVVSDFHFNTIRSQVEPMLIIPNDRNPQKLMVKLGSNHWLDVVGKIQKEWKKQLSTYPFELEFLNYYFRRQYKNEKAMRQVFFQFMLVAISIACLGLFSLLALITAQRIKEVGIRKAFGANFWVILIMLSKEYLTLIFIAIIIGIPVAIFGLKQWLNNFIYKTPISSDVFIIAGGLMLLLGMLTMAFHVIRATLSNPAKILKNE